MGNGTSSVIPNKFLEKEIDRLEEGKADKGETDIKFEGIEKEVEAATKSVSSWNKWFKGIVITVVVAIVTIVGTVTKLTFSNSALADDVGEVKEDIVDLSTTVDEVQTSQDALAKTVKAAQEAAKKKEDKRLEELKLLLDKAIHKARQDIRPRRRGTAGRQGR